MPDSLNESPRGVRLHIGIFGRRNVGKSSVINALAGHDISIVSDTPGTTTDPVFKSMEIHGIGPCVLIDTAGFDDQGELGKLRIEQSEKALDITDIALLVTDGSDCSFDKIWLKNFRRKKIPFLVLLNKIDCLSADSLTSIRNSIKTEFGCVALEISAIKKQNFSAVIEALMRNIPEDWGKQSITGSLCKKGNTVLLVMPQDIQAPKGRLILPQVQTIRELLDKKCIVSCCTADTLDDTLKSLVKPPNLIITDSQVFPLVWKVKPSASKLTSFSVLMAGYKGDIQSFVKGASAIDRLTENSHVLIAEACTHAPMEEDIGRVKIPRKLRSIFGENLKITMVSGTDFPKDLIPYDLIIHCGACMFNRTYMLSRIRQAEEQGVPITNYGVALAHLSGILDKIQLPDSTGTGV